MWSGKARRTRSRPARKRSGLGETTRFLLLLFLFALILRSFIIAPFSIPSGSMLPRMMIGDYLFVSKWSYGFSRFSVPFGLASFEGRVFEDVPERGDVAVFRYPGDVDEDYVKRVIGLPGDTVQMREGTLYLNGKAARRTRIADYAMPVSLNSPCRMVGDEVRQAAGTCLYPRYRESLPGGRSYEILDQGLVPPSDSTEIYKVPPGHYFVMGDNRDDSADSRFALSEDGLGLIPADRLVGKALITFFSTDGSAEWLKPWTWFSAARWERIGETF